MDPKIKKLKTFHNGGANPDTTEKESISGGLGSKSKPCNKFFSTSGCPYGEDCHYLHYVSGGVNAVSQMPNLGNTLGTFSRKAAGFTSSLPLSNKSDPVSGYKTRLCNRYGSAEGCPFADKCHFAHGEKELRKESVMGNIQGHERKAGPGGPPTAAANFGALSKANISIDASLASGIIGKGGINSKYIHRLTGVKLFIKDHDSDPNLRKIELEGSFDQITQATTMVKQLIMNNEMQVKKQSGHAPKNLKTKLCENYAKGSCTFGDKCHFAHGANEMRENLAGS